MASSPQHEPTMEEILASIRKIISEDSTEAQPAAAPAEADVLELTQEHVEAPPAPAPVPPPPPAPAPVMTPAPAEDIVFQSVAPAPESPMRRTMRPMPSSIGSALSKAALSPPTRITSSLPCACASEPETGASR